MNAEKIRRMVAEAETQEHLFDNRKLAVYYKFKDGSCLVGVSDYYEAENASPELCMKAARSNARSKVELQLLDINGFLKGRNKK